MTPRVTVLMPAYNAERHIAAAIDSILVQSFADFELLIVDDGSIDGTEKIIAGYSDPRIRYLRNPQNMRLAATLNRGLDEARGELVARMDADDIALPERLAVQVAYLDAHPDVVLAGSGMIRFDDANGRGAVAHAVTKPHLLRWRQHFANQVNHPTVMIRRAALASMGLRYGVVPDWARPSDRLPPVVSHYSEDYLLFGLLALHATVVNLPEALLRYRVHAASVSGSQADVQLGMARQVSRILFEYVLGEEVSADAAALVYFTRPQPASAAAVEAACELIDRALAAHVARYALAAAAAADLRRDADLRKRVLRRPGLSLRAILLQMLAHPILPRDAEEWRLAVRACLGERGMDGLKALRARLLARFGSPLKVI